MKYKLVFIDDNLGRENDPFVLQVSKSFEEDIVEAEVFDDTQKGLDYVLKNLNSKMIVFLDCKFDVTPLQGIDVFRKIREKTALLFVIIMSVNSLNQMESPDIIDMINRDYVYFLNRNNEPVKQAREVIERVKNLWNVRFDCVLESWIVKHPEYSGKCVYKEVGVKSYTWSEILKELRLQTPEGKRLEELINQYCISTIEKLEQNG